MCLALTQLSVYGQSNRAQNINRTIFEEQRSFSDVSKSVVSIASYPRKKGKDSQKILIGTGFIYHKNGYIVTLQSVIRAGDEILISFSDDTVLPGKVLPHDSPHGLVLIKVEGNNYPAVQKGRSVIMNRMSILTVIGNSLGIFPSVTLASFLGFERNGYLDLGAIIAPGNCGSPVFDSKGKLAAMILGRVYHQDGTQVAQGKIGVALPIELIKQELDDAVKYFNANRGWIGVSVDSINHSDFVKITDIVKDGPSDLAGLAVGDTVVMYEGRKIRGTQDLKDRVIRNVPGTKIALTLKKGRRRISHLITVSEEVIYPYHLKYLP